jgi:opacity protein-like surface antigen
MDSRTLAVVAGLIASPAVALADGLPPPPPPPVAATYCCEQAPPVWSGFYIGTNIGGAWNDPHWRFPFVEAFNTAAGQGFSESEGDWIWGGHLGLNYQVHRFVFGAEASYAGLGRHDPIIGPFPAAPADQFSLGATDLFTVAGRIGITGFHDQYLFYGKAGYANSQFELKATSSTGVAARASQRESGWIVGGGLESRIISNVIFGIEYNYLSFAGDRFTGVTGGTAPAGPFNFDIDKLQTQTFTFRLSVLFGPHACCGEGLLGKY